MCAKRVTGLRTLERDPQESLHITALFWGRHPVTKREKKDNPTLILPGGTIREEIANDLGLSETF